VTDREDYLKKSWKIPKR